MELREEIARALRNKYMSKLKDVRPWDEVQDVFKRHYFEMADIAIELMEKYEQISSSS